MPEGNKTFQIICRYLTLADFAPLHRAFGEAFADYFVPFQLSEAQMENHILQNGVALERSVGAFSGERLIGFTLNGFGLWNERKTVYDAGTGVVPEFRRQGVGKALFDFMTPDLKADGAEQILLEVISQNKNAIGLYEKLGFRQTRRLIYFERKSPFEPKIEHEFEIREIDAPDWELFESFADGKTSWQSSPAAVSRIFSRRLALGAFDGEKCVGYGIVAPPVGMISQLAVARNYRRRGAASLILSEMQKRIGADKTLRAANVDENIASAVGFLRRCGFTENFSQLEMINNLKN
jgi:ribosomal protein S18 acetylase RimI-like enzyme